MIKELITKGKYLMRLMEKFLVCTAFIATMATNAQAQMKTYSGRYEPSASTSDLSKKEIYKIKQLKIIYDQNKGDVQEMSIEGYQPALGKKPAKFIKVHFAATRNEQVLYDGSNTALFINKLNLSGNDPDYTISADADISLKVSGNYQGEKKNAIDIIPVSYSGEDNSEPRHSLTELEFVGEVESIVIQGVNNKNKLGPQSLASSLKSDSREVKGLMLVRGSFDGQKAIEHGQYYEQYDVAPSYQPKKSDENSGRKPHGYRY